MQCSSPADGTNSEEPEKSCGELTGTILRPTPVNSAFLVHARHTIRYLGKRSPRRESHIRINIPPFNPVSVTPPFLKTFSNLLRDRPSVKLLIVDLYCVSSNPRSPPFFFFTHFAFYVCQMQMVQIFELYRFVCLAFFAVVLGCEAIG